MGGEWKTRARDIGEGDGSETRGVKEEENKNTTTSVDVSPGLSPAERGERHVEFRRKQRPTLSTGCLQILKLMHSYSSN